MITDDTIRRIAVRSRTCDSECQIELKFLLEIPEIRKAIAEQGGWKQVEHLDDLVTEASAYFDIIHSEYQRRRKEKNV